MRLAQERRLHPRGAKPSTLREPSPGWAGGVGGGAGGVTGLSTVPGGSQTFPHLRPSLRPVGSLDTRLPSRPNRDLHPPTRGVYRLRTYTRPTSIDPLSPGILNPDTHTTSPPPLSDDVARHDCAPNRYNCPTDMEPHVDREPLHPPLCTEDTYRGHGFTEPDTYPTPLTGTHHLPTSHPIYINILYIQRHTCSRTSARITLSLSTQDQIHNPRTHRHPKTRVHTQYYRHTTLPYK